MGPDGAHLTFGGIALDIPAGALNEEVAVSVSPLADASGLPPLVISEIPRALLPSSPVVAFTPHGTSFQKPVQITLPYTEPGHLVLRLDDDDDTTWEPVQATLDDGFAHFETTHFSYYTIVYVDQGQRERVKGQRMVTIDDSGWRGNGLLNMAFDGSHVFWTRDQNGKLAVLSALVTGIEPSEPRVLFEAPWTPLSGWTNPQLIASSGHVVFPVIGEIDFGSGPVTTDGWASLNKSGGFFRPKIADSWWVVARGDRVLMKSWTVSEETGTYLEYLVSPEDGSAAPVHSTIQSPGQACVYDSERDEVGCLSHMSILAVRITHPDHPLGENRYRLVATAPEIQDDQFGSIRITFNRTHWFVPIELPSGPGIGAYSRTDGSVRHYAGIAASGAVAVDDQYMYACVGNVLTRIHLASEARQTLTEDCGDAYYVSIIGSTPGYVFYAQAQDASGFINPSGKLAIARASKSDVKAE